MTEVLAGTVAETARLGERVLAEVEQVIVGKPEAVKMVLLGVLASGHSTLAVIQLARPEMWVRQVTGEDVARQVLAAVPVPPGTVQPGRPGAGSASRPAPRQATSPSGARSRRPGSPARASPAPSAGAMANGATE